MAETQPEKTGSKTGKGGVPRPRGGGKKGRSGRRPFEITKAAQTIYNKFQLLEVAKDIAVGDIWEQWTNKDGEIVTGPTKNSDRMAAIRYIDERAWGKVAQPLTGPDGGPIAVTVTRRIVSGEAE